MRERGKSAVRRLVTPLVKLIACRGENIVDGFEIELLADDVPAKRRKTRNPNFRPHPLLRIFGVTYDNRAVCVREVPLDSR